MCVLTRNSLSTVEVACLSGMNTAGRRHSRMSNCVRALREVTQQSLASRIRHFVASSPTTGTASGRTRSRPAGSSRAGPRACTTTICERGTITSRTWISETCSTASRIASTSASMRPAIAGVRQTRSAARGRAARRTGTPPGAAASFPTAQDDLHSLLAESDVSIGILIPNPAQDFHLEALHAAGVARLGS